MEHVDELLEVVREYVDHELPFYTQALKGAFDACSPVFIRERYSEFFWHCASTVPGWIGQVVLANAVKESEGSDKLLKLWQLVDYDQVAENKILAHSIDESRHSRLFLQLALKAFPNSFRLSDFRRMDSQLADVRKKKYQKNGAQIAQDLLIDHLVQMNIGEVRTRLHMHLFAPVIYSFTPSESQGFTARALEGLVRDEVRHIGYTAMLMESWAESGDATLIRNLYERRLYDFHVVTVQETEKAVRDFGHGRFPDLLEI